MKILLLSVMAYLLSGTVYSQGGQLPVPKINTVARPDLIVTAISYISISRETNFSWVRISVTIKNAGDLRTGNTTLKGVSKSLVSGSLPNRWESLSPVQSVISINPGQSVTKEYLFKVSNTMAHKKFAIKVIADSGNVADESNERNNTSAELIINPL